MITVGIWIPAETVRKYVRFIRLDDSQRAVRDHNADITVAGRNDNFRACAGAIRISMKYLGQTYRPTGGTSTLAGIAVDTLYAGDSPDGRRPGCRERGSSAPSPSVHESAPKGRGCCTCRRLDHLIAPARCRSTPNSGARTAFAVTAARKHRRDEFPSPRGEPTAPTEPAESTVDPAGSAGSIGSMGSGGVRPRRAARAPACAGFRNARH